MNTQLPVHLHDSRQGPPQISGTRNIHYWSRSSDIMDVLVDWQMVFSRITPWNPDLYSLDYRNCTGIVWISPTGTKVLGHLCPGTFYPKNPAKFGTAILRMYREEVKEILGSWVKEGWFTDNAQIGIFGSCVFPTLREVGVSGYFDTINILSGMLGSMLPGDPQVLAEPSLGDSPQDVVVRKDGVHIYRVPPVLRYRQRPETHFTVEEIKALVRNRMPK